MNGGIEGSPSPAGLTAERFIEALGRRRASGALVGSAGVGDSLGPLLEEWGTERALVADDPLVDELGVAAAIAGAGAAVHRWPAGLADGWREPLGLEGPSATLGITVPSLAVAERGTLVLSSGPGHGRSIDAVCERHLALLAASRIRETLAEVLAERFSGTAERTPSAVSLVSGPSRTSDIEKISILGAHGALSMHVLVIADM